MRYRFCILFALLLCCAAVLTTAEAAQLSAMPQAVVSLCAEHYPGYTITARDGGGGETQGQFALVLSKSGHNILCIAEKEASDPAYILTIANEHAVRQGQGIPSLLIDTGGDALFYTYHDRDRTCTYNVEKGPGGWGNVGISFFRAAGNGDITETRYSFGADHLQIWKYITDPDDNIKTSTAFVPVHAPWLQDSFIFSSFDITLLPNDDLYQTSLPDILDQSMLTMLPDGYSIVETRLTPYMMISEVKNASQERTIVLAETADDGTRHITQSTPLTETIYVDFSHSWSYVVVRLYPDPANQKDYAIFGIGRWADGQWHLCSAMTKDDSFRFTPLGILFWRKPWYIGDIPTATLTAMQWDMLPYSLAEALETLDQSGWARVTIDDPNTRLHLRTAPEHGAPSLGRYYQGIPVRVLGMQGDWAEVEICGIHGYMPARCLAFGDAMNRVENAFPELEVWYDPASLETYLYASADDTSPFVTIHLRDQLPDPLVLGVIGEDWYHVLFTDTGLSGYMRQSSLWPGNG